MGKKKFPNIEITIYIIKKRREWRRIVERVQFLRRVFKNWVELLFSWLCYIEGFKTETPLNNTINAHAFFASAKPHQITQCNPGLWLENYLKIAACQISRPFIFHVYVLHTTCITHSIITPHTWFFSSNTQIKIPNYDDDINFLLCFSFLICFYISTK